MVKQTTQEYICIERNNDDLNNTSTSSVSFLQQAILRCRIRVRGCLNFAPSLSLSATPSSLNLQEFIIMLSLPSLSLEARLFFSQDSLFPLSMNSSRSLVFERTFQQVLLLFLRRTGVILLTLNTTTGAYHGYLYFLVMGCFTT